MRKLIPLLLVAMMLHVSSNAQTTENVALMDKRVVVLDAGHGGPRPGKCVGKVREADINLAVAKAVKASLNSRMPDLEVYLTRDDDTALHADRNVDNKLRAEFANKRGSDLLLSIHANAADSPKVCGSEVWVLSLDEDTLRQNRKNAGSFVDTGEMMLVENISKSSMGYIIALTNQMTNDPFNNTFARLADAEFKSLKRHSRGVKYNDWTVLYWLEGPGALVELGFMTNADELAYMTSDKGVKELGEALASSIIKFVESLDKMQSYTYSTDVETSAESSIEQKPAESKPADSAKESAKESVKEPAKESVKEPAKESVKEGTKEAAKEGYAIQLLSSRTELSTDDTQFKVYRGRVVMLQGSGSYKYKYCLAGYATAAEARADLQEVRKHFADAYVVRYSNGSIAK
ncbi:MAG: N-acetylmuramoyl-L-alanine amidase [Alistipes sp.]|nr:N-acetylmuramoyl-L-alanine amidase [Alistipes sp.]